MHVAPILMQFFMFNLNTLSDLEFKQILNVISFIFVKKMHFFMQNNHKENIYASIISLICSWKYSSVFNNLEPKYLALKVLQVLNI